MEQDAMQGIMGLQSGQAPAQQSPMPASQNAVPQVTAEEMAAFERARQEISPTEFTQELMRAGEEIDPQAVSELRQDLMQANLPMELAMAMLTMVEGLLGEPGRYAELRAELIAEGVPEDILPEQFDGEYLGALQLAVEQMIAMQPAQPVQAFAQGGLASLKPIAKELQSYGRNGDTMLAHITPQEARMLQRMGGSGTINPVTGLREYFVGGLVKSIGNAFKSAGKAVVGAVKGVVDGAKKFVKSPIGKIATAVALGYFLGPAAAGMIGVSSTAGVAAVSGFVGGFGSSMLGGSSLKESLITGATGAVMAGAGAGIMGGADAFAAGSYTGPTTVSGQWEQLKSGVTNTFGGAPGGAEAMPVDMGGSLPTQPLTPASQGGTGLDIPVPQAPSVSPITPTTGMGPANVSVPTAAPATDPTMTISGMRNLAQAGTQQTTQQTAQPGFFDRVTDFFTGGGDSAVAGLTPDQQALQAVQALPPGTSEAVQARVYDAALKEATPGVLSQYGPYVAAGLGVMSLTGGFDEQPVEAPGLIPSETGFDLLQQDPERYGVTLGPTETVYAGQAQQRPMEQEYADYYASMQQNPYMTRPQQMPSYSPNTMFMAEGGEASPQNFPRRNGPINGPGTETSDSIPAMLSDGEFVMTARAVRGAGGGSRRAGAKRMYQMMKELEGNA